MRIRPVAYLVGAFLVSGIAACSSGNTEPTALDPCQGPVAVVVTPSDDAPTFSWAPACRVTRLEVFSLPGHDADDLGLSQWRVESSTLLAPPIRYGVAPPSAGAISAAPLLVGNAYIVFVERDTGGVVVSEGAGSFVR